MDLIPSERGWWIQAFEAGDTVIVDPYTDIATGKTIISACYPFYVDGKPFAVLADIDVTTVLEIINQIEEKQFCEGFLLSASGDVITHKNSEWLPTDEGSTNLSEVLHTDLQSAVRMPDSIRMPRQLLEHSPKSFLQVRSPSQIRQNPFPGHRIRSVRRSAASTGSFPSFRMHPEKLMRQYKEHQRKLTSCMMR